MNGITPWAAAASFTFSGDEIASIYSKTTGVFHFDAHLSKDSLWMLCTWPKGGKIAFRLAYAPDGEMRLEKSVKHKDGINFHLNSLIGHFSVQVRFTEDDEPVLKYITALKPNKALLIPYWPKDILIPGKNGKPENTAGKIHVQQVGTRSGLNYFSLTRPKAGSVLYLQNLTALADYCEQTQTSCADVVGGEWPELGFALPPTMEKPLLPDQETIISDAIVVFSEEVPADEATMVRQYLNLLAKAYLHLPLPETNYHDWPEILKKGLKDLIDNPGCWSQVNGHPYFNAYVCDYATPPEIMVQLAVLLPLLDYVEWSGIQLEVMQTIKKGLPSFFDKDLGTIMRWLPAAEDKLEGEEEQKQPKLMDSWYLHHPLLNLSRMALKGDKVAKQLFLDSLDFCIKVAHHFKYQWPVFYHMETLEVVKAETSPGKGGEKDVAGLYTHVMLQAYELTGKKRFLNEAEKAAKTLKGLGFELFYQANNTAFASGALLRLYKLTKKQLYLDLSYLCLANVFKNVKLWDCNYGYGKNFSSFFAVFPLSDAPYTAVYEEQEVFCALHEYLRLAEGETILPSVSLLIAEFIRSITNRALYYYPTSLPKEMLSEKVKIGEVDPDLWIALEDLQDGWKKSGEVGQEVYGAGNVFGIIPRHYTQIKNEDFMLFVDYPIMAFSKRGKQFSFSTKGDERLSCRMVLVAKAEEKLPFFKVIMKGQKEAIKGKKIGKDIHYTLRGSATVSVSWK